MITIKEIVDDAILFDNGDQIIWDHFQDCCEEVYADFDQIKDCVGEKFNTPIQFEGVEGSGFRFGNGNRWVFVPCYNIQNGYYNGDVDVYYVKSTVWEGDGTYREKLGDPVLSVEGEYEYK